MKRKKRKLKLKAISINRRCNLRSRKEVKREEPKRKKK